MQYKAKRTMSIGGKFFEQGRVYSLNENEILNLGSDFERIGTNEEINPVEKDIKKDEDQTKKEEPKAHPQEQKSKAKRR